MNPQTTLTAGEPTTINEAAIDDKATTSDTITHTASDSKNALLSTRLNATVSGKLASYERQSAQTRLDSSRYSNYTRLAYLGLRALAEVAFIILASMALTKGVLLLPLVPLNPMLIVVSPLFIAGGAIGVFVSCLALRNVIRSISDTIKTIIKADPEPGMCNSSIADVSNNRFSAKMDVSKASRDIEMPTISNSNNRFFAGKTSNAPIATATNTQDPEAVLLLQSPSY